MEEETIVTTIKIPKDILEKIDKFAEENRRSRSSEIIFRLEKSLM